MQRSLTVAHLYPSLMNLYGDRGNILCLQKRCAARGILLEVDEIGLGTELEAGRYDFVFIGGGQDREQRRIADDLLTCKGPSLRAAVEDGLPMLAVCGGYQMLGQYYQAGDGGRLPGLGIFDVVTKHAGDDVPRCIGNVVVEWERGELVGFENHGGRTYIGPEASALGAVAIGFGNNGEDGTEGCRYRNAIGTYLHGSLLPKNPAFADYLLSLALSRKYGSADLPPLDDRLELAAHAVASARARRDHHANPRRGLRGLWARLRGAKRA